MTEHPTKDAARYLRHWSVAEYVATSMSTSVPGVPADRRRSKAKQAAFCVGQALEYLESATASSLFTKPLPLFYAAENLAKAACLIKTPHLLASDFKAHGLKSDQSRRNSIKNLQCAVYSKPGKDVWTRLFATCNADVVKFDHVTDGQSVVGDQRNAYATKPLYRRVVLLGNVLRHLPELAEDVRYTGWGHPFCVRVDQFTLMRVTGPPAQQTCSFLLRHNHDPATKAMVVDRERDLLRQYSRTMDVLDVVQYSAGINPPPDLTLPVTRLDVFGQLFMDFRRSDCVLSELCLYFIALFILSSVVRYEAEQWKRLIDDHPLEAILIDRFLDLAVRKLPNLLLNELTETTFLFQLAR